MSSGDGSSGAMLGLLACDTFLEVLFIEPGQ